MPAPPPDARSIRTRVEGVEPCGDDGVILALRPEIELDPIRASRFFMLRRTDGVSPLIPRPFSIYRQRDGVLEFLIKIMGRGTRALAEVRPGQEVLAIGPLGNGWPALDGEGAPWVMLAGGVGSAPFHMAIEQALAGMDGRTPAGSHQLHYLFGAATSGLLYDLEAFRQLGIGVHAATDDGSEGHRGNVLQLLEKLWEEGQVPREVRILACGPDPMLEAVAHMAEERGLSAWLSLETMMGCGVGICNGCPVETRPDGALGHWPNAKCCVEGPVFSSADIHLGAPGEVHGSPGSQPRVAAVEAPHEPACGNAGN